MEFRFKSSEILIGIAVVLLLYGLPRIMNKVGLMLGDPTPTNLRAAVTCGIEAIRSSAWAWRDLPSARFAIAFSLFLTLLAASFLVDSRAVFDTLQSAVAPAEQKHVGDVFYSLPDRAYCRHMSFDNATSQLVAGNVAPCPRDSSGRHQTEFSWGGH